jgi:hypothetical protein
LFICLVLYLFSSEAFAMAPEGSDLPKPQVKVSDNHNTVSINNSTFHIPDAVAKGLTNVGTGAAVAAGLKAGAKSSGLSPTAKIGVMAAGAIIGGSTVTVTNTLNSISQKKIDSAAVTSTPSNPTVPTSPPTSNPSSGDEPAAFSIESTDTVMSLLDANHTLHICISYLPIALMILYISTMVVENK